MLFRVANALRVQRGRAGMFQRVFEVLLLIALAWGAVCYWRVSSERYALQAEHSRLVAKVGDFVITDPTKVHLRAIKTDDPGDFAWRAYFPPKYDYRYSFKSSGGSQNSQRGWMGVIRLRFRIEDGGLVMHQQMHGGSGVSGVRGSGGMELHDLLRKHPDFLETLQVEQLAAKDTVVFSTAEEKVLLKLSLPEKWHSEARDWKGAPATDMTVEEFRLGPDKLMRSKPSIP
jgi:hypothetical protein